MKIKLIALVVSLFLLSFNIFGQENSLSTKELKKIITFAKITELNNIKTDFEKDLSIRLVELPVMENNNCFPESHGVCEFDYYLSISRFDENPDYNVFKIGRFGKIVEKKWKKEDKPDYAEIAIVANKYSDVAVKYNKNLVNINKKILLKISVDGVKQQKM